MSIPRVLTLFLDVEASSLEDASGMLLAAHAVSGLGPIARWEVPAGLPGDGGPPALAAAVRAAPPDDLSLAIRFAPAPRDVGGLPAPGHVGGVAGPGADARGAGIPSSAVLFRREEDPAWTVRLHLDTRPAGEGSLPAAQRHAARLCAGLLARGCLVGLFCEYQGDGGHCLPSVPLAGHGALALATTGAVAEAYDDPAAFWGLGWERLGERDGRHLLGRALDAPDTESFLAAALPGQWALARAACPGRTRYDDVPPLLEESSAFFAGEQSLYPVGHIVPGDMIEYTCALSPGEHIPGWEILALRDLLKAGATESVAGGSLPVRGVRVVFAYPAAAEQEKRPLLDIGVSVYALGDDGWLAEVAM